MLTVGKLDVKFLDKLLKKFVKFDKNVIVGPQIGEDAAVLNFGNEYLVATIDPITFTTSLIGWYSVIINANDIAAMGAVPKWFLCSILLPKDKETSLVENIFRQIEKSCKQLNITLIGGHTEVTEAVNQVVIVGCMLGKVERKKLVRSSTAKIGDKIVLIKGIAIEGTSIIAREKYDELKERIPIKILNRAKKFIFNPGISILKEALIANKVKINSMHDPTEGGLAMGLFELTSASGVGARVYYEKIKIYEETKIIAKEFDINPLNLIASGSLILTVSNTNLKKLLEILNKNKIEYSLIGEIIPQKEGLKIVANGKEEELRFSEKDEIIKIF